MRPNQVTARLSEVPPERRLAISLHAHGGTRLCGRMRDRLTRAWRLCGRRRAVSHCMGPPGSIRRANKQPGDWLPGRPSTGLRAMNAETRETKAGERHGRDMDGRGRRHVSPSPPGARETTRGRDGAALPCARALRALRGARAQRVPCAWDTGRAPGAGPGANTPCQSHVSACPNLAVPPAGPNPYPRPQRHSAPFPAAYGGAPQAP